MDGKRNMAKLRLLVAIASYGERHLDYLSKVISAYRALPLQVRVVVLSEAPKNLGDKAEVVVGLPAKNPWSLPFAHKPLFAREAENFDLFIYSEDDILFTKDNLEAFLRLSAELPDNEIAGFLLYEQNEAGKSYLPNFHDSFRWKAESVRKRGRHLVAEFTNEHSGFYLLTQQQLKQAIASGGFLREPYEARHDMLCAAATDPYTCCGFQKVICISEPQPFLLHHLPNRYVGRVGIPYEVFQEHLQALELIYLGKHPARTLCEVESRMPHCWWSKSCYEPADEEILAMVPSSAKTLLSVGCGSGMAECQLKSRGGQVTALPLDSVVGLRAARLGLEVVYGSLEECHTSLGERRFDGVFISNLLHLQPCPERAVKLWARFVRPGGTAVVTGYNFERVPYLLKRVFGINPYGKLRSFQESGISRCSPRTLGVALEQSGFEPSEVKWLNHAPLGGRFSWIRGKWGGLTAEAWVLRARRVA